MMRRWIFEKMTGFFQSKTGTKHFKVIFTIFPSDYRLFWFEWCIFHLCWRMLVFRQKPVFTGFSAKIFVNLKSPSFSEWKTDPLWKILEWLRLGKVILSKNDRIVSPGLISSCIAGLIIRTLCSNTLRWSPRNPLLIVKIFWKNHDRPFCSRG